MRSQFDNLLNEYNWKFEVRDKLKIRNYSEDEQKSIHFNCVIHTNIYEQLICTVNFRVGGSATPTTPNPMVYYFKHLLIVSFRFVFAFKYMCCICNSQYISICTVNSNIWLNAQNPSVNGGVVRLGCVYTSRGRGFDSLPAAPPYFSDKIF